MSHASSDQAAADGGKGRVRRPAETISSGGRSAGSRRGRIGPIASLIGGGIVLIAAIAVGVAMLVADFRARALADQQRELAHVALILAEHIDQVFHSIELVQEAIIERSRSLGATSSQDFEREMSSYDIHTHLKERIRGLLHVDAFTIVNADGKLINFSRYWPIPTIKVADREYFKALKADPGLTSFVSEPVRNRGTGTLTVFLARRISGPNGEFIGLVAGAMELQYFERFFSSIGLQDGSSVTLFRRDGTLLARYPPVDPLIGRSFGAGVLFTNLPEGSNNRVGRQVGVIDGEDRIIANHAVEHYPVVVAVTKTVRTALAQWERQVELLIAAGILAVFAIGGVIVLVGHQLLRGQRQSARELQQQKIQLDTALGNMAQGLCMFDAAGTLVLCNERAMQIFGLSREVVKPGCTVAELVEHGRQVGSFSPAVEQLCSEIRTAAARGEALNKTLDMPDGRTIHFTSEPIASGGWVVTQEDITERRRGELVAAEARARTERVELEALREQQKAKRMLERQKIQLDTALDNMSQGLVMFDATARMVLCNERFIQLYGLSREVMKPGMTLMEILQYRKQVGSFAGDPERYCSEILAAIGRGRTLSATLHVPDGRTVLAISQPIANGGWVATHEDITERRRSELAVAEARAKAERAETEARAAHARLLDAFAAVPEGLVLFDAEDRYVLWNRRYAEIYAESAHLLKVGAKFEDVLRAGLAAGHYEEATGREDAWLAERLARLREGRSVHEIRRGNRWLRLEDRRFSDGGSIGIRVDITELKQREAAFRLLFDGNPLPMYVFDAESLRFLAVNDAALAQFGHSREQFLAMTALDLRPPDEYQFLLSALRTFSAHHMAKGRHYIKADGTMFEADIYAGGLNFEGRPARFAALVDTTDQRRAERERDRNRQFLDQVIENVPTPIFVKNARDRRYLLVNRAGEEMWGYSRGTLIGRTAREIYAPDVADAVEAHDNEVVTSRRPRTFYDQLGATPAGGTVLFNVTTVAIVDENGEPHYLLTVADDLTERRAVENQLRQAQKMEAVGNLTGGLAHDFNNLLMIIIGNLDLLQEDVAGIPAATEKIETILQASLRGADLTRQLLAFSRRHPLQPTRVDVEELLHNTARLLERTLGEHVAVKLRPTMGLWPVNVDKAQLEAALVNLAINARDAMPGGGTLAIETTNMHVGGAEPSRQPDLVPGDYVVIQVSDSGTGMPPEVVAHIFEPFYTTKGPGKGTGLGLSMVYGFIKQSGGHIAAFSEVGTGTIFKLYLPRAGIAEADIESTGVPSSNPAARGEVILAVDDNAAIRATAAAQLRDLGYQVLEADSAQAALEVLERVDKVDLLFTDIVMPGMNGKELATCARAKRRELRILFTSGFLGAAQPDDAVLDEGDVLLGKPYRKHDLARAVHEVLNARL